jgi:diguanylate cyclase (GGDEF)-like protein
MRTARWLLIVAACWTHTAAFAYSESGRPMLSAYSPRALNSEDHPVGPQFFAAASDARGVLLIAHNYGISEFDGARWRTWRNDLDSAVLSLALAPDGRIAAGGTGSFGWFERSADGRWHYRSLLGEMPADHPTVGDVWFAGTCDEGLVYRAADFVALWRNDGGLRVWRSADNAFHLSGVVRGRFYVREKNVGLKTLRDGELVLAPGGAAFAATPIYIYLAQDDGQVLLVDRDGTRRTYDPDTGASAVTLPPEASRAWWRGGGLYSGARLSDGRYAFGTIDRGLAIADSAGTIELVLDRTRGLRDNLVFGLHGEPNGDVWALLNDGATRVNLRAELTQFDTAHGVDGFVEAIARTDEGLMVAASNGVFRLRAARDAADIARFEKVPGALQQPWTFLQHDGEFLVGANNGIFQLAEGEFVERFGDVAASYVRADPYDANRWFVSGGQGLAVLRRAGKSWTLSKPLAEMSEFLSGFQVTAPNELWIGTEQQRVICVRLRPGRDEVDDIARYGAEAGLPKGQSSVHRTPDGWLLGSTAGMMRYDPARDRFEPDASMRDALAAWRGASLRSWLGERQWRVALEDKLITLVPDEQRHWRAVSNVLRLMPSGGRVLSLLDEGEVLWVGSDDGVFRWQPRAVAEPIAAPTVQLSEAEVRLGSQRHWLALAQDADGLMLRTALPPQTTGVRFAYALPDYADPTRNRYRTRLVGLESDYGAWTAQAERELSGLRHGEYRLLVQARNVFGEPADELAISFRVAAPWYATPWAQTAMMLLALGLALWFARRRGSAVRARNLELERAVHEKTQQLLRASRTDALTGLYNRRHFEEAARLAFERVRLSASNPGQQRVYCDTVGVLLIDLDHFKAINDQFGHDGGDAVLVEAAARITRATRAEDHVMRWGGEEFLVLAPGIDAEQTDALARRILDLFAAQPVRTSGAVVAMSCSVGWTVSDWSANTAALPTLDDLLALADKALYLAKREGRARACGAIPGPRVGFLFGNAQWKRSALDDLPEEQVALRRSHPRDPASEATAGR